jgi:glycosyltransferase involved in cell wall biosynthesis
LNIALFADNLVFGGVNRYCLDLAEGLKAYPDVRVSLLALPDQSAGWLLHAAEARGASVQALPMRGAFDLSVIRRLRCWLWENQAHILHSQGYRSNLIARLAVRGGRLRTGLVCTVHGIYPFTAASLRLRLFYALDYLTMPMSDRIIAVSAATRTQLARWGLAAQVIRNGTALPPLADGDARRASRLALGIAPDARVVLFVGRLAPEKGPDVLIDVAHKVLAARANAIFLIVGDGPAMPALQNRLRGAFPRVILAGQHGDVTPFYRAADVLVLPSRSEGLPMTLIEAFAHGLPAVASRVGGIPEVVQDGVNGFLCDADQPAQMCERLENILSDDALRRAMGVQARRTVETDFTVERMSAETYHLYRELEP